MKSLLVEDNPADARLIHEMLKDVPPETLQLCRVDRLSGAQERLRQEPFDVVLLDLGLPDAQGLEALSLAHAAPAVPIIVLTGRDDEAFALEAVRAGAQDYLVKGRFDRQVLLRTIRYAVERQHAEEEIRRLNAELEQRAAVQAQRELLQTIVNHLPAAVNIIRGNDLTIQLVNPSYQAIAPGKVMLGKTLNEVWPETGRDFVDICRRVLTTGQPHHATDEAFMISRTPGQPPEPAYFSWSLFRVRLPGDEGWGILNTAWETTARKRAEEALRQTEAAAREATHRLQVLMEAVPVGISFSDDATCQRITGNHSALAQFEVTAQDNLSASAPNPDEPGRQVRFFRDAQQISHTELPLQRAVAENRVIRPMELEVLLPSGRRWFCEASGAPVRDADGKVFAGIAVTVDITERKRAEEALVRAEKLATAGRMAATLAHEINNPLAAITNCIYLALHHAAVDDNARQYLRTAEEELFRVSRLAQETLGFYRERTQAETASLGGMIDEVLRTFDPKLRNRNSQVSKDIAGWAGLTRVPGELRQVLSNIVANSIDALPLGGSLQVRAHGAAGRLMITVADSGTGIAAELRERIFEPFFTTKQEFGTGLGLWVARELLRKHGGSIRMRSRPGHGTVFSIFLPVPAAAAAVAD